MFLLTRKKMQTIAEIQNAELSLSAEKALPKYGLSTRTVLADGKPPHLKLQDELTDEVHTPFAPSAFGGTGTGEEGERLGLALVVPQALANSFLAFEAKVLSLLRKEHPKIDQLWRSAVKESDEGLLPLLKTKIQLTGPRSAVFFDAEKKPTGAPENWKAVNLNTCLSVRGVYIRKDSAGLQLDATHVQWKPRTAAAAVVENPF
jgi:hypothetical protein